MDAPVTISAAIFVSLIFLDLFRHEYKIIPVHAILGIFTVVLMTFLCDTNRVLLAWVLLLTPFILLTIGILVRQRNTTVAQEYPVSPIQKMEPRCQPAPYYM